MENSLDPNYMPHSVASDLGLHCLLKSLCPNTWGKYDILDHERYSNVGQNSYIIMYDGKEDFLSECTLKVSLMRVENSC